jgi:hypothetical protein
MLVVGQPRGLWMRFYLGELIRSARPALGGVSYLVSHVFSHNLISQIAFGLDHFDRGLL